MGKVEILSKLILDFLFEGIKVDLTINVVEKKEKRIASLLFFHCHSLGLIISAEEGHPPTFLLLSPLKVRRHLTSLLSPL